MFSMFSKNDDKKCQFCQSEVDSKIRPVFRHLKPNNKDQCSRFICIWCCNQIVFIKKDIKQNKNGDIWLDCCKAYFPKLTQKMKSFLDKNCVVCGSNCKSERLNLGESKKLHVGKQCYLNIANKFTIRLSSEQEKLKQKIQKFSKSICINCEKYFNILKATQQSLEFQSCQQCLKKTFKQQKADLKSIKKCSVCLQPDIFQKLENKGFLNLINSEKGKKLLNNIEFQIDHINKKPLFFCPYCLYEIYLDLEVKQKKNYLPQQYLQLKNRFQIHFGKYCMTCGLQSEKNDKIFIIKSPYLSLISFICNRCRDQLLTNKCRFQCADRVREFLQKTNQHVSLKQPKLKFQLNTIVECNNIKNNVQKKEKQPQIIKDLFFNSYHNEKQHNSMELSNINTNLSNNISETINKRTEQKTTIISELQSQLFNSQSKVKQQTHSITNQKVSNKKKDESFDHVTENVNDLQFQNYQTTPSQLIDFIDGFDNDSQIKVSEINLQQQLIDYCKALQSQPLRGKVLSPQSIYNQVLQVSLSTLLSEQTVQNEGEPIDCKCFSTCKNKQPVLNLGQFCDPCFYMYLLNLIDDQKIQSQVSQKVKRQTQIHMPNPFS